MISKAERGSLKGDLNAKDAKCFAKVADSLRSLRLLPLRPLRLNTSL
jgi:hypothetical protein